VTQQLGCHLDRHTAAQQLGRPGVPRSMRPEHDSGLLSQPADPAVDAFDGCVGDAPFDRAYDPAEIDRDL
jgi:hypothetical protein